MMPEDFSCRYHQNRNAIDKCENCGAYLCLECKNIFRDSYTDSRTDYYSNKFQSSSRDSGVILCPKCYFDRQEVDVNASRRMSLFFPIMFFVIFFGGFIFLMFFLFTSIGSQGSSFPTIVIFFPIMFIGFIAIIILVSFRQFSHRKPRFPYKRKMIQNTFYQPGNRASRYNNEFHLRSDPFCNRCGSKTEYGEKYCSNCGMALDQLF
ncbi:MAG: hypothetical protein ACXACP_14390 [Candidatus Hodarchaeales archaeon]|jgi:hypothetical protein